MRKMNMPGNTSLGYFDGIFAKMECQNPTGSIKDRPAEYIIRRSRELGILEEDQIIVDMSSGNFGVSLARWGRHYGHKVVIVMPSGLGEERERKIRDNGAELVLCGKGDFKEGLLIRDRLVEARGYFTTNQFGNELNVECHRETTGPEILEQVQSAGRNRIDAFVDGIGTGGTYIGVMQFLKSQFPNVRGIVVEPENSPMMKCGLDFIGDHDITGIGDKFIPEITMGPNEALHGLIDKRYIELVSGGEAEREAKHLAREYGVFVGPSAAVNYAVSQRIKLKFETVVTVFPDSSDRYLSRGFDLCDPERCGYSDRCD
jgi:cysteine synthase